LKLLLPFFDDDDDDDGLLILLFVVARVDEDGKLVTDDAHPYRFAIFQLQLLKNQRARISHLLAV